MAIATTTRPAPGAEAAHIEQQRQEIVRRYGEWTAHNIHLGHDIYTTGKGTASRKLQRIVQATADIMGQPLETLRVLDLACLEGGFAIEFARHGAQVAGIEGREANLAKARFAKEVLGLHNLTFHCDDVRNLSVSKYGSFDVVICAGILYHLDAPDVFDFVSHIAEVCTRLTILDTSVSLRPAREYEFHGRRYFGGDFPEHEGATTAADQTKNLWGSIGNMKSVWLTRPSLLNLLAHVGFTSVFDVQNPSLVGQFKDRVFLAAIKSARHPIHATPMLNQVPFQDWPEKSARKYDPMQRRGYRLNKAVTAMIPKPLRRAAKSALIRVGLRKSNNAPWNWKQPWQSR
jgi:SAM-dependent methyltransferase